MLHDVAEEASRLDLGARGGFRVFEPRDAARELNPI
jgi:hypothetical protein